MAEPSDIYIADEQSRSYQFFGDGDPGSGSNAIWMHYEFLSQYPQIYRCNFDKLYSKLSSWSMTPYYANPTDPFRFWLRYLLNFIIYGNRPWLVDTA